MAVAADLCTAALGTENFGSISYPAQQNGIVGLKPTLGLVSRYGNVPTTYTLDTIGPMVRCVQDAAIVLGAIAGRDEHDPATWTQSTGQSKDYADLQDRGGLNGSRIGICQCKWDALSGERKQAYSRLRSILSDAGAILVEVGDTAEMVSESDIDPVFFCECKSCMNAYLSSLSPNLACRSLQQVIEFNQRHADRTLRYGQPILLHVQNKTSGGLTEVEYLEALLKREQAIHRLDQVFDAYQVDVLLCTAPEIVAPITGFPSMSVPLGIDKDKMPFGSYWIAGRYDEATLLRIALAVESLLEVRCTPGFG